MDNAKRTRRVRVGHDFVPQPKHCYVGFRSRGSFSMELTDEQIELLADIRSKQIKFGQPGTPVIELIPDEEHFDAR